MTNLLAVIGGGSLLIGLCALACPVGMGVMMWMMNRGGSRPQQTPPEGMPDPEKTAELARLRAEIDQLKAAETDPGGRPSRQHQ